MLNAPLLRDIVFWAMGEQNRMNKKAKKLLAGADWDQGYWGKEVRNGECHTAYCMAGAAVVVSGYKMQLEPVGSSVWSADYCYKKGKDPDDEETKLHDIDEKARQLLGLTGAQASRFFDGDNTMDDIVLQAIKMLRDVDEELFES